MQTTFNEDTCQKSKHAITFLFTKSLQLGNIEKTFLSTSQTATCPVPTCLPHTVEASHCLFNAERQAGKLLKPIFIVFGLTYRESNPSQPLE